METYKASQVISGTFGEVWLNADKMSEATALQAKVSFKKTSVAMCGTLVDGQKISGIECKGTLKLNKITSKMITLLSEDLKAGKQSEFTIMSKLADPDSLGAERIVLKGVMFDEMTLIDWEAKKNGDESMPFTFMDWDLLDVIA